MAWTAPMTAVANAVFTAAQFNTHVRDNLLETSPAKATTAGSMFITSQANSIAERIPTSNVVLANETTTSGSFVDLTTPGPIVTVDTGTSAMVWFAASGGASGGAVTARVSVAVSGATTVAASSDWEFRVQTGTTNTFNRGVGMHTFTGLNAGSNVFTMKYTTSGATTTNFNQRELIVIPL